MPMFRLAYFPGFSPPHPGRGVRLRHRLALALGLPLTYSYGGARTFGYLAGAAGLSVVLVYLAVNLSVFRAFRTGFRAEFRVWRHLVIPATAVVFFFFPGGIRHPRGGL